MHLYKYMPYRDDFFKNPILRVTKLSELNDPFEGNLTLEQIKKKNKILNKYYDINEIDNEFEYNVQNDFELSYDEINHEYGIIAFSEDPLNILMWSHYAKQHKGIVVQIEIDNNFLLNSFNKKENIFIGFSNIPEKVKYSMQREAFLFPEEILPNNKYEFPHKNFYKAVFLNKSNDWLYEKEYRSILELINADIIQAEITNSDDMEELKIICEENNISYSIIDKKENIVKIAYPLNFEYNEECGDECIRNEIFYIVMNYDASYFYKVNPKSIKRVIFGSLFDKDINKIILNCNFDCDFYQTKISDTEFKLEIERL